MRASLGALIAAAALATAVPVGARRPGPPLCGDSPEAAARWARRELRVAQRAFPKQALKLLTPTSCTCHPGEPWCTRRTTALKSFALAVPDAHVDLVVSLAVLRLRPPPAPLSADPRPPRGPERVLVVPFASVAAAMETAARLRQQPLTIAAFGRETPLTCVAYSSFTYNCSPAPSNTDGRSRLIAPEIIFAETPPGTGAPEQPLRPTSYRLPAGGLPPNAPYWNTAWLHGRVARVVTEHPEAVVEILPGPPPVLLVRERPGSDAGLAVTFRRDAEGALVADRVTPGARRPAP